MFTLRLFGGVSLEGPEGPLVGRIAARQALAVLAVLATSGDKGVSRDKLIEYFWADRDATSARHLLSNTLYVIRKALGEESINATGEVLRLDPDVTWCDVRAFERALRDGERATASELYHGPFLDGFYLDGDGAAEFERWIVPVRQRLARSYATAMEALAEEAEGDQLEALERWERLLAHDPFNSRYAIRLMLALAAARDPANALQFADEFERRIREDLGMEPDPELRALAERLRKEPMPAGVAEAAAMRPAGRVVVDAEATPTPAFDEAATVTGAGAPGDVESVVGSRPSRSIFYAAGIVLVLVATWLVGRVQDSHLPPDTGTERDALAVKVAAAQPRELVVLADFSRDGSASGIGLIVTETMRIDLAQSRRFALLEGERLQLALERMQADPDSILDARAARDLARREGVRVVIAGDVQESGQGFEIIARLVAASSGGVLFEAREVAQDSSGVIPAIGRLSRRVREGIGEPLEGIEESATLPLVTTSSLEALRLYSKAVRARWSGRPTMAVRLLQEAIAIDTAFAMAHAKLALFSLGLPRAERVEVLTRAFKLGEILPARERNSIALLYHYIVRRDVDAAIRSTRALVEDYPDDYSGLNWLANFYSATGNLAPSEFYYGRAVALDSSNARGYFNATLLQVQLGRLEDARHTHERMLGRFPNHPWTGHLASILAVVSDDRPAAQSHLEAVLRLPDLDVTERLVTLRMLGALARIGGELFAAEQHLLDAVAISVERNRPDWCLEHTIPIALADVSLRQDRAGARLRLDQALESCALDGIDPADHPYALLAQAYAAVGDLEEARSLLDDYVAASPQEYRHWTEQLAYRMASAELALAEGEALRTVGEANQIQEQRLCTHNRCDLNAFVLMARAYDIGGQPDSARVYYERYVHAPGYIRMWPDSYWLGPIYERLATLYAELGRSEEEARYLRLLADLWGNADEGLRPRVEAARRRLGKLESRGVQADAPAER